MLFCPMPCRRLSAFLDERVTHASTETIAEGKGLNLDHKGTQSVSRCLLFKDCKHWISPSVKPPDCLLRGQGDKSYLREIPTDCSVLLAVLLQREALYKMLCFFAYKPAPAKD
jgi:hypothetical protein